MRKVLGVVAIAALAACSSSSDPIGPGSGEPNDTIAQATPTISGALVPASIASPVDVDYYAFTVPAQGATVRIQTFDPSGTTCNGIDTFLEIYSPAGMHYAYSDDTGIGSCEDYVATLASGTWYVAVTGVAPSSFPYTIRITVTPTPGESEPNDSIGMADGPIPSDAMIAGSISTTTDYDYFAVTNPSASSQNVYFETFEGAVGACPSADTELYLYDGAGSLLALDDDGGINWCSSLSYSIPAYTTYYIRVSGWLGDTFSYLLIVDFP